MSHLRNEMFRCRLACIARFVFQAYASELIRDALRSTKTKNQPGTTCFDLRERFIQPRLMPVAVLVVIEVEADKRRRQGHRKLLSGNKNPTPSPRFSIPALIRTPEHCA